MIAEPAVTNVVVPTDIEPKHSWTLPMRKFLLFLIVLGAIGYFVWPTPYKEYGVGEGPFAEQLGNVVSRVDRISGEVYVKEGVDNWRKVSVRRPELLRPDITGPTPSPGVDQGVAQQQQNTIKDMQSHADQATQSARSAAGN